MILWGLLQARLIFCVYHTVFDVLFVFALINVYILMKAYICVSSEDLNQTADYFYNVF